MKHANLKLSSQLTFTLIWIQICLKVLFSPWIKTKKKEQETTWDHAIFSFCSVHEILVGKAKQKEILEWSRIRECMKAAKIGPDLRLDTTFNS